MVLYRPVLRLRDTGNTNYRTLRDNKAQELRQPHAAEKRLGCLRNREYLVGHVGDTGFGNTAAPKNIGLRLPANGASDV